MRKFCFEVHCEGNYRAAHGCEERPDNYVAIDKLILRDEYGDYILDIKVKRGIKKEQD